MKLTPVQHLLGRLKMPGDKSVSHRAAMISALAKGQTYIENFSSSADCVATLACLQRLGVEIERAGRNVTIIGEGISGLRQPPDTLDCGNSGTTMRLLAGIVAGKDFTTRMVGDDSLSKRPMGRIVDPLQRMGAVITATDGRAPLEIKGRESLWPLSYELPVASAQVKSCVLLAGLMADGKTEVIERTPTRDHTERMLRYFGVQVGFESLAGEPGYRLSVTGPARFTAMERLEIPGDISTAAFFMAGAAVLPGSELFLENVGLNSTRVQIVDVLQRAGANIEITGQTEISNEPVGTIRITGPATRTPLKPALGPLVLSGPVIAQLIDELPILAVLGTQIEGGITIHDAVELRHKESDRIAATVKGLRAMGALVEEHPDGLTVMGPVALKGALIDAHRDHRIAMAFGIAALLAEGETEIDGAEDCVSVSCPDFFELLASVSNETADE
ncbi:MAG: 3-phosphoshikimate 1-carboxyvinyltransferase [Pyrinomonadaceae bacterium]